MLLLYKSHLKYSEEVHFDVSTRELGGRVVVVTRHNLFPQLVLCAAIDFVLQ